MISNFANLDFKESSNEIRMTPGKDDFGSARAVLNCYNIGANSVSNGIFLCADAFTGRHDTLKFSKIQHHITPVKSPDCTANNFSSPILELLVDHLFLDLTDTLSNRLTGCLSSDTTEVPRRHFDFNGIADLGFRVDLECL